MNSDLPGEASDGVERDRGGPRDPVLWAALASAFALRSAVLWVYPEIGMRGTEVLHYVLGVLVVHFGSGVITFWGPAYEGFLAGVFAVAGPEPHAARWVQVLVSSATVGFVYGIARSAGGTRAARIAAIICALYPSLIAYSHYLFSETLYILFLCSAVYAFSRGPNVRGSAIASGILFGLASLTRSLPIFFLPLWAGWALVRGRPAEARRVGIVLALALAVVFPWTLRNAERYQAFQLIDPTIGSTAFLAFNTTGFNRDLGFGGTRRGGLERMPERRRCTEIQLEGEPRLPRILDLRELFPKRADSWTRYKDGLWYTISHARRVARVDVRRQAACEIQQATRFATRHPEVIASNLVKRTYWFWGPNSYLLRHVIDGVYPGGPLGASTYRFWKFCFLAFYASLLASATLAFGMRPLSPLVGWIGLFLSYYSLAHALALAYSRYRIPLMPFLIIAAATWLAKPRLPSGRARRIVVGFALIACAFLGTMYVTHRLP